ncbi:MAG: alpha/beta hydrolase [Ktedonobacteraceae bacterium]
MFSLSNVRRPRPSLKSVLLGSVGGSVGLLGVIIAVGLYIVETLTRPTRLATFALYTFSPFELGIPAEEVAFPPLQGEHEVSGWYVPCPDATTTIILSPGFRGSRTDVLGLCALLWKAGHNILVFEYFGHGTVVGQPVTLGYREINDFLGAVAYARQRAPHARLGAVGYSMGAAVSIMGCARTAEVEALVADSAFATHRRVVEYAVRRTLHLPFFLFAWVTDVLLLLRAGYRFNQVEPLRDIVHIAPRPILIIHGTKDSIVDPSDATLLYNAAGDPKDLWIVPGVEHCGVYFADRAAYTKRVINFFDTYLKNSAQPLSFPTGSTLAESEQERLSEAS